MTKALRIIAIAMPFVIFILFFVPYLHVSYPPGLDPITGNVEYNITYSPSIFDTAQTNNMTLKSCTILFYCIAVLISIIIAIESQKSFIISCGNFLSCSYFWIYSIKGYSDYEGFQVSSFNAAFYISLILSAFFLAVFIAYAVKRLKARFEDRPPREHKPTKSERIADLERQVAELQAKKKDTD